MQLTGEYQALMAFLEYTGTPRQIWLSAGTGVREIFLRVALSELKTLGVDPIEDYDLEGTTAHLSSGLDHGFVLESQVGREGVLYRVIIDTRYMDPPAEDRLYAVTIHIRPKLGAGDTKSTARKSTAKAGRSKAPPPPPVPSEKVTTPVSFTALNLRCTPLQESIPVGLVLDLGNTRSFALLVDDLRGDSLGMGQWKVTRLDFEPHATWTEADGEKARGLFDSFLVLEDPQRIDAAAAGAEVLAGLEGYGNNFSFVRLGREVESIAREMALDGAAQGRFSLSSPKRYFWQDDRDAVGWKMH
ncbi:MAG: hypothetical protein HN341_18125, partial [Verrucomicrobia bacterium]|nr:hypothetical protein [Verrucomicrobiota bacterium]